MKNEIKKLSRSNTRNNLRRKMKILGWTSALSLVILLNSCGPADLDVKKSADKFQQKTEKVNKLKKSLKNKEEKIKDLQQDIKDIETEIKVIETNITDAEKEAVDAKVELQKESKKL